MSHRWIISTSPSVGFPRVPHFSTLFHKRHDFGKKVNMLKTCVLVSLQRLSEIFLILRGIQRDIIIIINRSLFKASVILVRLY
jgi:hypothetical protein